jgi:hypothetical protein
LSIEVPHAEDQVTSRNCNNRRGEGLIEGVIRLIPTAIYGGITHHNPELEALF